MQYHADNIRELPKHKNTAIRAFVAFVPSVSFVPYIQILQTCRGIQKHCFHIKIRGNQLHDGFHAGCLRRVMA